MTRSKKIKSRFICNICKRDFTEGNRDIDIFGLRTSLSDQGKERIDVTPCVMGDLHCCYKCMKNISRCYEKAVRPIRQAIEKGSTPEN